MAASFLKEHDDLVASGQRPHRVTNFFCGPAEDSLRGDMEAHAAGHGMSDRLRQEVRAYQLCKIDDTWAEAARRDVSGFGKRATAAKVAYVAASQRLGQTLGSLDNAAPGQLNAFYDFMRKHKAIGQQLARRAGQPLRSVHKKVDQLWAQVYRYDQATLRDWGVELNDALKLVDDRPLKRRSLGHRLQLEYLASVLNDGQVISVPPFTDAIVEQANATPLADLPALFHTGPVASDTFFQLVDMAASRKKQLRTAAMGQNLQGMARPVILQSLRWWPAESEQGQQAIVYYDGYPRTVDLLALAPWPVLRISLRRWQKTQASTAGCLALSAPETVTVPSDWRQEDVPAICLLEQLAIAGWARGPAPLEHTTVSDKRFEVRDPIASKAYLQCLLGLDDLVGEGKRMASLRSDQPALYYSCVLRSDLGQIVPLDQSAAAYKSLLTTADAGTLAPLADIDRLGSPAKSASESEVEVLVRRPEGKRGQRGRGRGRGRGPGRRSTTCSPEDWGTLVLAAARPVPHQPSVEEASAAPLALTNQSSASSAAASSGDPFQPAGSSTAVEPMPEQAPAGSAAAEASPLARPRPLLEGVEVYEEGHGIIGQPGSYRRLCVVCPLHKVRKTRSFGVRSAVKLGLGDLEAYAFLGAWLRECNSFAASADHKRFAPTSEQVKSYAVAHEWLPAA